MTKTMKVEGPLHVVCQCDKCKAQTEQEPVAWHYPGGKPDQCTTDKAYAEIDPAWTPMYYKHEWVGLTDEEIKEIVGPYIYGDTPIKGYTRKLFDQIEAKLREKNQ